MRQRILNNLSHVLQIRILPYFSHNLICCNINRGTFLLFFKNFEGLFGVDNATARLFVGLVGLLHLSQLEFVQLKHSNWSVMDVFNFLIGIISFDYLDRRGRRSFARKIEQWLISYFIASTKMQSFFSLSFERITEDKFIGLGSVSTEQLPVVVLIYYIRNVKIRRVFFDLFLESSIKLLLISCATIQIILFFALRLWLAFFWWFSFLAPLPPCRITFVFRWLVTCLWLIVVRFFYTF